MFLSLRAGRLIAAPALLAALVLPSTASASSGTSWFAGAPGVCGSPLNTFEVPSGVTSIHFSMAGDDGAETIGFPGAYGRGAGVTGDLAVTPGQLIYACLGVGGGAGGTGNNGSSSDGAAGGGYAGLANAADGSDPIAIAGGGGGASGSGMSLVVTTGGQATKIGASPVAGGTSGTANGGGSATDFAAGFAGTQVNDLTLSGTAGSGRMGGTGGAPAASGGAGGGGGGGYFGGGAGAGSDSNMSPGGGGGGGSSFCADPCIASQRSTTTPQSAVIMITWSAVPAMAVSGDGDFGDVKLGETVTRTYTVKSTGTAPLDLTMFGVTGGDPDFGFGAYTCGSTLDVGDECTVDITFKPTTPGTHTGTFTAGANGIASGTLALTANGVVPPSGPTDGGTGTTPPPTATPPAPQTITPTACVSRRVVDLKVPGIYRKALISAKAQIAGKTVANLKNGKGQIDLRGRTAGKVKVTLVIKLRGGRTRTDVRTYTTCGK